MPSGYRTTAYGANLRADAGNGLAEIGATVLTDRAEGHRSGIVSAHVDGPPVPLLAERLKSRGIAVSARSGGLRVSPHGYNTEEDIDRLIGALKEIVP